MTAEDQVPPTRRTQLLELAYRYVLENGLSDLSLRPLATAVGSSPRVLLYLFGSKEGLVRALLARARADELRLLDLVGRRGDAPAAGLDVLVEDIWALLAAEEHRPLLTLWVEAYSRSLLDPGGSADRYPHATVGDWLAALGTAQPPAIRETSAGRVERTLVLAVLRGALLDLLSTGDVERATAAVRQHVADMRARRWNAARLPAPN